MAKPKASPETQLEKEVSTSELANIVGKTPQWIRQLTRDRILFQVGRGKYILADAVQAYILYASGGKEEDNKPRLVDHKTEHERIKKEMAQLELDEMRNSLHTTEDVQEAWGGLLVEFRKRLTSLPSKLAAKVSYLTDEKQIRIEMDRGITAALNNLAQYDPLRGGGEVIEGDEETNA